MAGDNHEPPGSVGGWSSAIALWIVDRKSPTLYQIRQITRVLHASRVSGLHVVKWDNHWREVYSEDEFAAYIKRLRSGTVTIIDEGDATIYPREPIQTLQFIKSSDPPIDVG